MSFIVTKSPFVVIWTRKTDGKVWDDWLGFDTLVEAQKFYYDEVLTDPQTRRAGIKRTQWGKSEASA